MITDAPLKIQKVVDRGMAEEIASYVVRKNDRARRNHTKETTLADVCRRFGIKQQDALWVIENNPDKLMLSEFAYKPASKEAENKQRWGEMLYAAFYPQHWPDAPKGKWLSMWCKGSESE